MSSQLQEKRSRTNEAWVFFSNFLTHKREIGAVIPSSDALCAQIVRSGGVGDAQCIVEFGPGTGVITKHIVQDLQPEAKFAAIEVNPEFVRVLNKRFPSLNIIQDSAHNVRQYVEAMGEQHCDVVISGLPWASFPEKLQDELLAATVDILRPGGTFVTYSYLTSTVVPAAKRFRAKLYQHFTHVRRTRPVWKNMPPAFSYVAKK